MTCTGKVSQVTITDITQTTVNFMTDSRPIAATAGYKPVLGTYSCPRTDVFETPATTTPDGIPMEASVHMAPGQQGSLYLQKTSLYRQGTSDQGPCIIRGAVSHPKQLLPGEAFVPLKWPDCGGPGDSHEPLALVPSKILVTGHVKGKPEATVNLFDSALALFAQDIVWRGCAGIALHLTPQGFDKFHAPVSNDSRLTVWPTRIEIHGRPSSGGFASKIDIRDQSLAWPVQHLSWAARPDRILIEATDDGFERFGLTTDALERAARMIRELASAHTGMLPAIAKLVQVHERLMLNPESALHRGNDIVRDVIVKISGHLAE
jgi:hypothetical protein